MAFFCETQGSLVLGDLSSRSFLCVRLKLGFSESKASLVVAQSVTGSWPHVCGLVLGRVHATEAELGHYTETIWSADGQPSTEKMLRCLLLHFHFGSVAVCMAGAGL